MEDALLVYSQHGNESPRSSMLLHPPPLLPEEDLLPLPATATTTTSSVDDKKKKKQQQLLRHGDAAVAAISDGAPIDASDDIDDESSSGISLDEFVAQLPGVVAERKRRGVHPGSDEDPIQQLFR